MIGRPSNSVTGDGTVNDAALAIYPDPVTANFKIEITTRTLQNIRIIDALGREVLRFGNRNYSDDTNVFSGNASNIPNGIYYCIAQTDTGRIVQRFIVSH
jgi:hypothetical protein